MSNQDPIDSAGGLEIPTLRRTIKSARKTAFPSGSNAAYMVISALFVAVLAAVAAGCGSELSRSLGNIDSVDSSESSPGDRARNESWRSDGSGDDPSSEWAHIRRSSKPDWAKGSVLERSGGAGGSPSASERGADSDEEDGGSSTNQHSLVAVDRQHALSADYTPEDLTFVRPLDIPTLGGGSMKLQKETAESASKMLKDARKEGMDLVVCSAYRSYEAQIVSYGRLTSIYGEEAKDLVAEPGHSEHQLGTAIDVSNAKTDYRLVQSFADTESAAWMRQNAVDYGFVLSYPRHAEEHTGYRWEPWHYRYVGKENALEYERGDYDSPQQFFLEKGEPPRG